MNLIKAEGFIVYNKGWLSGTDFYVVPRTWSIEELRIERTHSSV